MSKRRVSGSGGHVDMSSRTKGFLQKICYKTPASVDMTRFGFICDSKVTPVNLLLKPLRKKLEEICGPSPINTRKTDNKNKIRKTDVSKIPKHLQSRRLKAPIPRLPKMPITPALPNISAIKPPCSTHTLEEPVRKTRVTFEEPCIILMKMKTLKKTT